jgi:hypothetical protein
MRIIETGRTGSRLVHETLGFPLDLFHLAAFPFHKMLLTIATLIRSMRHSSETIELWLFSKAMWNCEQSEFEVNKISSDGSGGLLATTS